MNRQTISLAADNLYLTGDLVVPDEPKGLVIFAHGSGSSRLSPRNREVAQYLNDQGLATLLFDLLTEEEDADPQRRFDITVLARRLEQVTLAVRGRSDVGELQIGYFGSSTGAAAALMAAAHQPHLIRAVVSRGGRPDLARETLKQVTAPTLLLVGGQDPDVFLLNQEAEKQLGGEKKLQVIPGAGHLFEEPGKLVQVAKFAGKWFRRYFRPSY